MTTHKGTTSLEILTSDYHIRRSKNPRFSKRSYARLLGISCGRLVDILNGKSQLSDNMAQLISTKLSLPAEDISHFLRLVENENQARTDLRKKRKDPNSKRLHLEEFAAVSDWEYFAFMALLETSTFIADKNWIARKLNLSIERLSTVMDHLLDLNFIQIDSAGTISNTYKSVSTLTDIPSTVLKKANMECILQALDKMHTVDVLAREITSLTFPVDPEKIKDAKNLIREFKLNMTNLMANQNTSEVYNLNIQFVPVSELGI